MTQISPRPNSTLIVQAVADLIETVKTVESPKEVMAQAVVMIELLVTLVDRLSALGDEGGGEPSSLPLSPSPFSPTTEFVDRHAAVINEIERFIEEPIPPGLEALVRDRPPESVQQNLLAVKSDLRWQRGASKVNLISVAVQENHKPRLIMP